MTITLSSPLADRDRWTAAGWCPLERTLDLIGTRSAMTLLREVFYGGSRFDDLARRAGVTPAVAAQRLRQLVDGGLLERRPYREPGHRTRHGYALTPKGHALFPILVALLRFGDELPREHETHLALTHAGCGEPIVPQVRCAAGHVVPAAEAVASIAWPDATEPAR
ncbi:winged helix-turn-helix transcriptional regulator [Actinoplanes siamensis]|uniref:Transcriptional regulator family protein n=1 Tax=Actinoplanes siamensis TaxID=1223317 RepID=A0A919TNR5_9ACTN|nr:helix-turn-helix domain-containing protein [Actinoplanes siamensis]GIF09054.1 transcriptional regulator family protein [Actinoplanes siamensis]